MRCGVDKNQAMKIAAGVLASLLLVFPLSAQVSTAITTDPPEDQAHPASTATFQLPSHGALLNALMYEAAGAGPHGTVLLLHGFPGNEKNLDVAQAMRRYGWNVLYFNYRGSWGSPGAFSFSHAIEDAQAALAYLREPANAAKLRVDPSQIVVMGHSMGGMIALYVTAHDPSVEALAVWSAADMAGREFVPASTPPLNRAAQVKKLGARLAEEGLAPLAGCTPDSLAEDLLDHGADWTFAKDVAGLSSRPALIITSDDGLAASADNLVEALGAAGDQEVRSIHLATDHVYSDKRIALETDVLSGLEYLKSR